jgi:hypothetical protein
MPRFKSNANLFVHLDEEFNQNWINSDKLIVPATKNWTYDREMNIDDVDLWEIIYEEGGGKGVYASYSPYAEFYLICTGVISDGKTPRWETYYGPGAEEKVKNRMREFKWPYPINQVWVDDEDLWLYQPNMRG